MTDKESRDSGFNHYVEITMGLDNFYRDIMDFNLIEDHEEYRTGDRISCTKKGDWWSLTFATSFPNSGSNHAK